MSEVGKVYRVTVSYPKYGGATRPKVKYGGKQVVSQTWRHYLMCHDMAQRRLRHSREAGNAQAVSSWESGLKGASFKVEVAPSAVFKDISDLYQIERDES